MKTRRSLWTFCLVLGGVTVPALIATGADAPTPARLFDGKSLDGWKKVGGGATYRIEDDAIVGEVGPGSNTFLRTEKTYGDFRLELDCKLDVPGNSGIQFRSHQDKDKNGRDHVFGYQCEIDPTSQAVDPDARAWSAGIYAEGTGRGWLYPLTGHPEAQKALKLTDWNHFVIEARGPHIKTWLNGVLCADMLDTMDLEGFIALQVHSGKAGKIRWKNITIVDYGMSHWRPIFDGSTLQGWVPRGGGKWVAGDGEVRGTSPATEKEHGHLFSVDSFGDLGLRLKFKDLKGNSGVYFRTKEEGKSGVTGLQADIDPAARDTGGLYEIDGRGWLVRPSADDLKKAKIRPDGWNELSLVAMGDRVVVFVNGFKTAELSDARIARSGKVALQMHAGHEVDVRFKDIEVLQRAPGVPALP